MKLAGAEAARRLASKPDPTLAGILLYGPDPMLVALTRQDVVSRLVGPAGEAEMRVERMPASELRRGSGTLEDAVRARGFFPGPYVVIVEGAADGVAEPVLQALGDRRQGDAVIVVTASQLSARSALRKGFEGHAAGFAIALYPDPPSRGEVEARLSREGLAAEPDAVEALLGLAGEQDPGAFAQTLAVLALYLHGRSAPATAEDVTAIAPDAGEGDIDALIHSAAEGNTAAIGAQLKRLAASGTAPTALAIAASRHFRILHAAASAPDGAEAGLSSVRPPVFGPRRSRMAAQARRLGQPATEKALMLLTDADLALRSARPVPGMALMERTLIRIAMLAAR